MDLISIIIIFDINLKPAWVQALSSILLAVITLYYAKLIKTQIKSERRQQHSNTLRDSVSTWIENLHESRNLRELILSQNFQTIPEELRNDPYIDDFKDNHAVAVGRKVEKIESSLLKIEQDYDRYIRSKSNVSFSYFPYDVELPGNTDLKDILFYLSLVSGNDSISDIDGVYNYIKTFTYRPTRDLYFPYGAFSTGSGANSESVEISETNYNPDDYRDEYGFTGSIASDFDNSAKNLISNMTDEEKSLLRSCHTHMNEIEQTYEELRALLTKYNNEAIYPGYCKFIEYGYIQLKVKKWLFRKIH